MTSNGQEAQVAESSQMAIMRAIQQELAELRAENASIKRKLEGNNEEGEREQPRPSKTQVTSQSQRAETVEESTPNPPTRATAKTLVVQKNARKHPFVDGIMETPLPRGWKTLVIDRYDGTTDPDEHMHVYLTQVGLYSTEDAIMCKVFPTSLKGAALSWFTRLAPFSIDCFDALTAQFETQFATSRPHNLTSLALINMRQEKGEPLRAFVERFGKTALSIDNLSLEVAFHQMINGLRSGPFADSLCKRPATSMAELRQRAAKYMRMEELKDFKNKVTVEDNTSNRKFDVGMRKAPQRPPTHSRTQRFTKYTPLNALRSRVLEEALHTDLLTTPKRASTPPNADTTRQCRYHGNFGHSTEECAALKDKIEELIQAGHLQRFVARGNGDRAGDTRRYDAYHKETLNHRESGSHHSYRTSNRHDREERRNQQQGPKPPLRGTINTIAGGFAGGGFTAIARKKHLRVVQSVNAVSAPIRRNMPPITFTSDDFKAIDPKQDDPMVITVEIENFAVKKVLIDQGSSVDILYGKLSRSCKSRSNKCLLL